MASFLRIALKNKVVAKVAPLACILAFSVLLLACFTGRSLASEQLKVAYAGPVGTASGTSLIQSIELFFSQINAQGGIDDKKIILEVYNDQNDSQEARRQAEKIVESDALAVIGHWYSSASLAAKDIYDQAGIPVLTFSNADAVTQDSDVQFRTIYNVSLEATFLAQYAVNILGHKNIAVFHGSQDYEESMKEKFVSKVESLGANVSVVHGYETNLDCDGSSRSSPFITEEIAGDLGNTSDIDLIFLASQAGDAACIVAGLYPLEVDAAIMGPGSLTDTAFVDGIARVLGNRNQAYHASNGILVSSPLIFDTANAAAQRFAAAYEDAYSQQASSWGAYAYDNAMLVAQAFRMASVSGAKDAVSRERKEVAAALRSLDTPENAVQGVTGLNYFDDQGDAFKPVAFGQFHNGMIISAKIQLQMVRDIRQVDNLAEKVAAGQIILMSANYMHSISVIYTGIRVLDISDWDSRAGTAKIRFTLWFRMAEKDAVDTSGMYFYSAAEPIRIGEPVEETISDDTVYRRYNVEGRFIINPDGWMRGFEQSVLGISFRHEDLPIDRLLLVNDLVGLGSQSAADASKKMLTSDAINPAIALRPKHVYSYQDVVAVDALGRPSYMQRDGASIEFSRFNLGIWLESTGMALRRTMDMKTAWFVACGSFIALIVLLWLALRRFPEQKKRIFPLQAISGLVLLFSLENVLILYFVKAGDQIKVIFDILWWLLPALILDIAIRLLVVRKIEEKTGRVVPQLVTKAISLVIYLLAIFAIIAFVLELRVTSLLATSGLMMMIIGLAIQVNLANIISGLMISMELPFRIGDWVKFGDNEEGQVVDINWRSTRIRTRQGNMLSMPNSQSAETILRNFSLPPFNIIWGWFYVKVEPKRKPQHVCKVLDEALASASGVRDNPGPGSMYVGIEKSLGNYMVTYCYQDYGDKLSTDQEVWLKIWEHLDNAGISPAMERTEINLIQGGDNK